MFSSEIFRLKSLGPLTPCSQILDDDGEGVLNTNLTRERESDRDHGEGDFVIALDLDPESEGDFVLGLDFDEAGPGFDSTDDLDLDDDALTN